jgi:3-hydroxyisobutyrate dehydrogenase
VGQVVTYLGESGSGQAAKQINQLMLSMSQMAIYEGMHLAKKMNLDLKMFARAVSAGCAQSWWLDDLMDHVFTQGERKYRIRAYPGGAGDALRAGKALGLSLPGAEAAHQTFSDLGWNIFIDFED